MTCQHKQTSSHFIQANPLEPGAKQRWSTCIDCGEWLPLGPATITPEVEIEIRAAELALYAAPIHGCNYLGDADYHGQDPFTAEERLEIEAGYLAAAILDEER